MATYKWLEDLLEDTKESESPVRFKLWSALYTVGAATSRKIYVKMRKVYNCYPNMYVMLIADSGLGKDFPIYMATKLLKTAGVTRMGGGRNSIEAIITEKLGKMVTLENGTIIRDAHIAVVSSEMSNLLIANTDAFTILTQLYDTHSMEEWEYTLRSGHVKLRNVFFNLLTATNMEHYNNKIEERDIKGGYIARTMCIHERTVDHLDSLMGDSDDEINWEKHAVRLREIATLSGAMRISEAGQKAYDEWYQAYYSNPPADKTGFVNRVRVHIIKVATCLSLIDNNSMIITKTNIIDAMDLVLRVADDIYKMSKSQGKYRSQYAAITGALMKADNYTMTRAQILNRNLGMFSFKDLTDAVETLRQGGMIEDVPDSEETTLRLTQRCIDELESKKKGT